MTRPENAVAEPAPELIRHSTDPLNAEPSPARLCAGFLTATQDFYIRSHGEIPGLDAATHRLALTGRLASPGGFSLAELKDRFPHRQLTAVMQCAGNRRADMAAIAPPDNPVSGDPWGPGAIGNACWTGIALADLLRASGADTRVGLHAAFACADTCTLDGETFRYSVSIPIENAMSDDVLLAWAMNGEPLSPAHGAPLRVVVPGFAGARCAKWLCAIAIQDHPADSPIQAREYRLFPSAATPANAAPGQGITIDAMPLNAAICTPSAGAELSAGRLRVAGYAIGGGACIARVELSADDGKTWNQAKLQTLLGSPWSWTQWHAELDLKPGAHELCVRAWDARGQTQPREVAEIWNHKGYLCNAWHRVRIHLA